MSSDLVPGSSSHAGLNKIESIGFFSHDRNAEFHPDHRSMRKVSQIIELGQEKRVSENLNQRFIFVGDIRCKSMIVYNMYMRYSRI